MTHPLVLEVRAALEKAADPAKAPKMQAYMKSAMPYRGVSSPEQKAIWKADVPGTSAVIDGTSGSGWP